MNKAAGCTTLVIALLLQGCLSGGVRSHNQQPEEADKNVLNQWLVPGKTTKSDVLSRLGPPDSPESFSEALQWRYVWSEHSRLVVFPLSPQLLGYERVLNVRFSADNRLISFSVNEKQPQLKQGDEPKGFYP